MLIRTQSLYGTLASPLMNDLLVEICRRIQLTKTQDQEVREHYAAVADWLGRPGSYLEDFDIHIFPQGSQNLRTTTRPIGKQEHDLDAVCLFKNTTFDHPGLLYSLVWNRIQQSKVYGPRSDRLPRCIRIKYAGSFHLDIVPALCDGHNGYGRILVPDLDANLSLEHPDNDRWKPSNPLGYAAWFEARCIVINQLVEKYAKAQVDPIPSREPASKKPPLRRVVQLLKRWRDVEYRGRTKLSPPSIILTTLAGKFYDGGPSCGDSLGLIVERINDWLATCEPVTLKNPAHQEEEICEKWHSNNDAYSDFRNTFLAFQEDWDETLRLTGTKLTRKLMKLFGEELVGEALKSISESTIGSPRQLNALRSIPSSSGLLLPASSIPGVRAVSVKPNTFFGDNVCGGH